MYSSFACLYIFVLFCFGLCASFFVFFVCFLYLFLFVFVLFFIYLECSMPFYCKIRAVHMHIKCLM